MLAKFHDPLLKQGSYKQGDTFTPEKEAPVKKGGIVFDGKYKWRLILYDTSFKSRANSFCRLVTSPVLWDTLIGHGIISLFNTTQMILHLFYKLNEMTLLNSIEICITYRFC